MAQKPQIDIPANQEPVLAGSDAIEPVEVIADERCVDESIETDEAPERMNHDIAQRRTTSPGACSLPDEEMTGASDVD
jgi:hypothetical protein